MPRPLRIHFPHAWYHVMNRGAGRKLIFRNDTHRRLFLELLNECHEMFNIIICAYCLMDNHYHILLSTPEANLSRVMRHINGVYTQRYNRLMKTDGPLFRGRYKCQLVDEDCYHLIVSRYIHLNPVKAGLVTDPAQYKWSSYAAYLELVKTPAWLNTKIILNQISTTHSLSHIINYQDYVENRDMEEINVFVSTKLTAPIIGTEQFKEKILSQIDPTIAAASAPDIKRAKTIPQLEVIIKNICIYYYTNLLSLIHTKKGKLNWPRLVCMYISKKHFAHTLQEISKYLQCRCTMTVSSTIHKCQRRLKENPILFNEIEMICAAIKKDMGSG